VIFMNGDYVPEIVKEMSQNLPRFGDGRINYSSADIVPTISIIVQYKGEILIFKRSEELNAYPGLWNGVSGYLDEVQPIKGKVFEELLEETQISKDIIKLINFSEPFDFYDEHIPCKWVVYPIRVVLKQKLEIKLSWENSEYQWVIPKNIKNFKTVPSYKKG